MVQIKFKLNLRLGRKFVEEMKLKTDLETQDPQAIGMFCKKKNLSSWYSPEQSCLYLDGRTSIRLV